MVKVLFFSALAGLLSSPLFAEWETVETTGEPVARHEAAFVEYKGKFLLIGGRRINPVSVYDPATNSWADKARSPEEAHHFQPVVYKDAVYIICAMTGRFPHETGLPRILKYFPDRDVWEWGHEIPAERRRGGAGVVLRNGKFYIVGGIVRGHMGGYTDWFDEYDPETGEWKVLENAPNKRDHFQATMLEQKLYAAGGRRSSHETGLVFDLVEPNVDVFDFKTGQWSVLPKPLPTPRAGNTTMTLGDEVLVIGGETRGQRVAHNEVEAYSESRGSWRSLPGLERGRHGTGAFVFDGYIHTCSGSGNRGGSPELKTMERIAVDSIPSPKE